MQSNETAGPLELKWTDLKIRENAEKHHTSNFDLVARQMNQHLIVRRGQQFTIDFVFYRSFDAHIDSLKLVFEFG